MVSDPEFYRAAQAAIQKDDDEAARHAAQRDDELMAAGDTDGRAVAQNDGGEVCARIGGVGRKRVNGRH